MLFGKEFFNTMNASRFEIILAKLFGKKSVGVDSGCTVVCYHFRGKSYITDVIRDNRNSAKGGA